MGRMMARQSNGFRATISVGVLTNGQRETAFIEDVSAGGFRLRGLVAPKVGQVVRVHAKGAMFDAEIRWADGPTCGLQYREERCAGDLQRFMSQLPRLTNGKVKGKQAFQEMGVRREM